MNLPTPARRLRPQLRSRRPATPPDAPQEPGTQGTPESRPTGPSRRARLKQLGAIELLPTKVKKEQVMTFARQTSSFVKTGIPLLDAFAIIAEDTADKKLREVLESVSNDLRSGSSLSNALERQAASFPKYFVSMIRSAELTGRLDEVLDQLAVYIARDLETRRKIKSAMTYPAVIFIMAIATIVVLSLFVLPKFQDFFLSFDAELPWATKALVSITGFMSSWGGMLALAVVWLLMAIALATRREPGKLARDRLVLRVPRVGMLVRTASIERFCHIMAVMIRAGVPLTEALAVAGNTTGNRVYRRGIAQIRSAIIRGADMAGPVKETKLFPASARQMIRVGEATGTLEEQLIASADFFGKELEYKLKRFTDIFEPMVVAFMGVVVGFVAYALVSAMYGIFNQVNA